MKHQRTRSFYVALMSERGMESIVQFDKKNKRDFYMTVANAMSVRDKLTTMVVPLSGKNKIYYKFLKHAPDGRWNNGIGGIVYNARGLR